jgi:glucuronate isomerase
MILYNVNPAHNYVLATMTGNFQDGSIPGKLVWADGVLDQKEDGMATQRACERWPARPVCGMLTDSRSFMSYPRHEYFRRLLCNLLVGCGTGRDPERRGPSW